ncbi:MAG TPA: rhodanese-like domain-containing protein [Pyrinomonadaceae bacterium]|jgi:Tfp pilus assembly protein PilW
MRFILTMLMVAAFAVAGFTACKNASTTSNDKVAANKSQTASQPHKEPADDAPRISLADAKKDFDAGNAVFVDTRAEIAYKQEHVKGSINVPMEAVETRYKDIPTDKKIIAYCS